MTALAAPRPDVLADVLTLAERERPSWASDLRELRESGVPLNAEGDDQGTPETGPDGGNPDEPDSAGSPSESPDDGIDWKQRYEDLRPEADRRASLIADLEGRNGQDRYAEALREVARIELQEEQEAAPEEFDDLDEPDPNEEIGKIREELAQRDAAAEEAYLQGLEEEYIEDTVEELETEHNLKLNDKEYSVVVNHAVANRDPHDGRPDLKGGFELLKEVRGAERKRYTKSKDGVEPPAGTPGEPKIDLRNKDARQKLGVEVFEAAERAKEE